MWSGTLLSMSGRLESLLTVNNSRSEKGSNKSNNE